MFSKYEIMILEEAVCKPPSSGLLYKICDTVLKSKIKDASKKVIKYICKWDWDGTFYGKKVFKS